MVVALNQVSSENKIESNNERQVRVRALFEWRIWRDGGAWDHNFRNTQHITASEKYHRCQELNWGLSDVLKQASSFNNPAPLVARSSQT